MKRKEYSYGQKQAFKKHFGRNLHDFWDNISGFKLSKFEAWLKVPEGESISDILFSRYGSDARELVGGLL